jgi:hypothetical protein
MHLTPPRQQSRAVCETSRLVTVSPDRAVMQFVSRGKSPRFSLVVLSVGGNAAIAIRSSNNLAQPGCALKPQPDITPVKGPVLMPELPSLYPFTWGRTV